MRCTVQWVASRVHEELIPHPLSPSPQFSPAPHSTPHPQSAPQAGSTGPWASLLIESIDVSLVTGFFTPRHRLRVHPYFCMCWKFITTCGVSRSTARGSCTPLWMDIWTGRVFCLLTYYEQGCHSHSRAHLLWTQLLSSLRQTAKSTLPR